MDDCATEASKNTCDEAAAAADIGVKRFEETNAVDADRATSQQALNTNDNDDGELDYEPSEPENSLKDALSSESDVAEADNASSLHDQEQDTKSVADEAAPEDNGEEANQTLVAETTSDILSDEEVVGDIVEGAEKRSALKRDLEDGELDELEEGEVKDDSDVETDTQVASDKLSFALERSTISEQPKPKAQLERAKHVASENEPKPEEIGICKFFIRGQCTWANFCKFLHPGYGDSERIARGVLSQDKVQPISHYPPDADSAAGKGVRQLEGNGVGRPSPAAALHRLLLPPPPAPPTLAGNGAANAALTVAAAAAGKATPVVSAWERGVKQAREMMRKAEKRENEILAPVDEDKSEQEVEYVRESKFRKRLDFNDDAGRSGLSAKQTSRPYSIDDKRPGSQRRSFPGHRRHFEQKEEKKESGSTNDRPLPYHRPSYENNEWRDPWMRSSATLDVERAGAKEATRASSSEGSASKSRRRRRRSASSSSRSSSRASASSFDGGRSSSSSSTGRRRRRRRTTTGGTGDSSTSHSRSRSRSAAAASSLSPAKSAAASGKNSPKSVSSASSENSSNARRRNARDRIASRKIKKMDEGRKSCESDHEMADRVRVNSSASEHSPDLNEVDQQNRTSLGFDIKHLINKKITAAHDHVSRKPIKMKIVSKSRVKLPASYDVNRTSDGAGLANGGAGKRQLSPLSPSDLPSDDDDVKRARWGPDGSNVLLEDISSEDDDAPEAAMDDSPAAQSSQSTLGDEDDEPGLTALAAADASDISSAGEEDDEPEAPPTPQRQAVAAAAAERSPSPPPAASSTVSSRREELLRQLRAVEDAIAKKRTNKAAAAAAHSTPTPTAAV